LRANTIAVWMDAHGRKPTEYARCGMLWRCGIFSFMIEKFVDLLRKHDIALVVADTAGKWPFMEDATSDFVYVRLHGDEELYVSGYSDAALQGWERKIRAWARGDTPVDARLTAPRHSRRASPRDIFVYFDNDAKVRAPFDAMSLAHRFGLGSPLSRASALS
jgi:uncharacterized protein YecE (DUF72 family)